MIRMGWIVSMVLLTLSGAQAQEPSSPASDVSSQLATCAACHGADGKGGVAEYPRLAGLGEQYLRRQLEAFASGDRDNAVMAPLASALSAPQRSALARHFSQIAPGTSSAAPAVENINEAGRKLAQEGRWEKGIPACIQCHGAGGVGIGEAFPALAGQPARYLQDQLKAWRSGARKGDPMDLMAGVAKTLGGDELAAVAEYFATLPAKGAGHE